ncbi:MULTISPECIES: 2-succinyl-6-hydroxy-2,4-cyclohexadiene-1-carboxylate synthase [Nostocales]|uniref:2-succinyl-6-hydroxy-2, 4-cyclohexadiene-1-carboxylate synthase n=1 Tax=Dolichospermum flos-aquae UHCC 0037 TaxID=2590026 RepID=A0ACC7S644_DOLFA|nr:MULTISPECIES: 2-succinyl-6-hydroxy-2,4-cyclohexadiene-1-carboxylate synthase [Nostocales]MBO1070501.1 2-succinyl-6-hydroxy-2,4-cyclohexadiene-1-carboxylate synthase [Dolichospermum sp. DEX189]MCX5983841.1 2-succinyl-6-hydroxy-2,4-cyclohexadiene-1-carboxylate synthase [Nostocales cyanobacterium LacPavin_0920_SED1_MAG_38_18]ALB43199.1 alpha/beta hydrolase [Anabaena sp. WA102]MBO1064732.1 2-succinyl-6-hydroxy-2,4-cyclohexadiene-1-carboxylate synthase [Anabaena sp. 54]MTJ44028.1 2-succinyl-6-hy
MIIHKYQFHYSLNHQPNKPIILFLHGFMGNIYEFDQAIKLLVDDFSHLTIDLPGHGKTHVLDDECYTMASTAAAIIQLLDQLKIDQCYLIGYSMGGRLALYLTLYFPQRFIKVILESASPGLATETARLARIKSDAQIAKKLTRMTNKDDFDYFLHNWYQQPIFGDIKNHPQYQSMIASRLANNPLNLVKSLQFMGTGSQPSLWEFLPKNTIPLLLLVGEEDEKFMKINMEVTKKCNFVKLQIIDQIAHNIHLENTVAFVQNMQKFFSRVC